MTKQYNIVNGTAYHLKTSPEIIKILERVRQNRKRIHLYLGDTATGKDWDEHHDVKGTIGRSTGTVKIPILLSLKTSHDGGGILTHCIVKITETIKPHKVLYQHSTYHRSL